ncbi:MAG: ABC transporter permease, partial [Bacteroides sp.]|nr:ABC transporter permease [Bacteroides sp.]
MLKMIFHQLWNQRKQNGWIFLELLVVSFFLWTVIDPVYVLIANRLIDPGYKSEGAYVVRFQGYMPNDAKYNAEVDDDSIGVANYWHIARIISDQPEVESYSISKVFAFPY